MSKWEMVCLKDVCEILDNLRVPVTSSNRKKGIYPYYGANGIQDYVDSYIFDDELVLLAEDGGHFGSKEKPIAYRVSGKCWVNNHAHVLKPKTNLDVNYLCYSIMYYDVLPLITGTTRAKLNQAAVHKMIIPLPPLPIQQKIADTLDHISNLIKKRKEQIKKLDLLVKSRFVGMFGDPVTNPMGWEKAEFGKTCDIITGNTPSRTQPEYYGDFIEWIKTDNIKATESRLTTALEGLSEQGFKKCRYVEANNILMTCIAGSLNSIGNVAITDRRVAFNQQINALIPKKYNHIFLYVLLKMMKSELYESVNMMLKGILTKGRLFEINAIVPPLALQTQFAEFVQETDKIKFVMQKGLEKMEIFRKKP